MSAARVVGVADGWRPRARLLAALPEFVSALYIACIWIRPATVGREGVLSATLVVALELPLLALAFGLRGFLWGSQDGLRSKARYQGRILAGACAVLGGYMAWHAITDLWAVAASAWLTWTIVGVLAGKALQQLTDRHRSHLRDMLATGSGALCFALCFLLAEDAPPFGLTDEALAAMDLPAFALGAPALWHVQWSHAAAAAVAYFCVVAVARLLLPAWFMPDGPARRAVPVRAVR